MSLGNFPLLLSSMKHFWCVCLCVCVCVRVRVRVVSLCKKFYLQCLSLPSCLNGDLATGEAATHQWGTWRSKYQLSMYHTTGEGPGGLLVPTPSPVGHGTASCRLLVLDLPVVTPSICVAHRCPSAGSLGRRDCASMAA